jgi:hypothetical protein
MDQNNYGGPPVLKRLFPRPGLICSQQMALNERARQRFGWVALMDGALLEPPSVEDWSNMEFSQSFLVGGVYNITLRYTGCYVPPHPERHDVEQCVFKGGHPQEHVHVTPAIVAARISINQVEVVIDTDVRLSCGNGPGSKLDRYILHRDGTVRYWQSKLNALNDVDYDNDVVNEWTSNVPRWEFTKFPVLPSVVHGI